MDSWEQTIQPPMMRSVQINKTKDRNRIRLPLPWVVYYTRMRDGEVRSLHGAFCSEEPTFDSVVYYIPLPNVYSNWKLCLNNSSPRNRKKIELAIQYWWAADFSEISMDWIGCKVMTQLFGSIAEWAAMSQDDVLKVQLPDGKDEYSGKLYKTLRNFEAYLKIGKEPCNQS